MVWKRYAYLRTVAAIALGIMLMAVLPASARLQLLTQPTQTVTSAGGVGNGFLSTPETIGAEFTIRTVSTVEGNSTNVDGETMWLAGFGTQKGAAPSALAVTWSPKASWFGYTWQL